MVPWGPGPSGRPDMAEQCEGQDRYKDGYLVGTGTCRAGGQVCSTHLGRVVMGDRVEKCLYICNHM